MMVRMFNEETDHGQVGAMSALIGILSNLVAFDPLPQPTTVEKGNQNTNRCVWECTYGLTSGHYGSSAHFMNVVRD